MRIFSFALASIAGMACVLVYGACADGDPPAVPAPLVDAGEETSVLDGGAPGDAAADGGADASTDAPVPLPCSDAGWCETRVEDGLAIVRYDDLWPLGATAFAVDQNNGIIEFDGDTWHLVRKENGFFKIWAPSANELWAGGSYGNVIHGIRAAGTWTWTEELVGANGQDDLVTTMWGSSADDIYFTTNTKLYHRVPVDPGNAGSGWHWVVDYQDTQPAPLSDGTFTLTQVTGSGPDDVWIQGYRGTWCGIVFHEKQGVLSTISDCTVDCTSGTCMAVPIPGVPFTPFDFSFSGFVPVPGMLISASQNGPVAHVVSSLQKITLQDNGGPQIVTTSASGIATGNWLPSPLVFGVWGPSPTDLYVTATALVFHNPDAFSDAGAFSMSTLAAGGLPIVADLIVRGTSASDIWVFGGQYVLHRSSP